MGVTGREATMAFGVTVANSWGVATSVTRRIYFESDAGMTSKPTYVDDASFGQTFLGPADVGDFEPIDVTLTGQAYYDHWDHWLEALAMGSPATPVVSAWSPRTLSSVTRTSSTSRPTPTGGPARAKPGARPDQRRHQEPQRISHPQAQREAWQGSHHRDHPDPRTAHPHQAQ